MYNSHVHTQFVLICTLIDTAFIYRCQYGIYHSKRTFALGELLILTHTGLHIIFSAIWCTHYGSLMSSMLFPLGLGEGTFGKVLQAKAEGIVEGAPKRNIVAVKTTKGVFVSLCNCVTLHQCRTSFHSLARRTM